MKKRILVFSSVIVLASLFGIGIFFDTKAENQSEVDKAVVYIKSQAQNTWNTMALSAAGEAETNLDYLKSVSSDQKSAMGYAKYILALTAAGKNPVNFGDENYVEKLKGFYQAGQFGDENLINDDIWAILALGSLGQANISIAQDAKNYILNHKNSDGGWGYGASSDSDTNDTAAAIMSLLEAGESASSSVISNAVNYLKSQQNDDGGFPYSIQSPSDSCSDAWITSAIYKLGQDPVSSNWQKNGKDPVSHLISLQDTDGGFWWQSNGDNKSCTSFALISLLGKFYPVQADNNLHHLRIEGKDNTVCDKNVSGKTALDLIIKGSQICGYNYLISEYPGMGNYLAKINGQESWMYLVNSISPLIGADSYYLEPSDEVLWFTGDWLEKGWFPTKIELTKTDSLAEIYVKYFDSAAKIWKNLEKAGLKVKIGSSELITDNSGKVEVALSGLEEGFYQAFVENQIIDKTGYIRSEKVNLTSGQAPLEHQVGLKVEIEKIKVPAGGKQNEISFSVSPDMLDFGKLKPGQSSAKTLTINNNDSKIYLETEVSGAKVFKDNLNIAEKSWQDFSIEIETGQNKVVPIKLSIPLNYNDNFGSVDGSIIFWAIKK
ncbi:MAG: prenyltransferase/squalene oxidase repeat-containing protein [Patescibacteria group bacterium]